MNAETEQNFQVRGALPNLSRALARGSLTVGFVGGSITDARPRYCWPDDLVAWMTDRWPGVRIKVENAAIGATNSQLACFRAQRDLVQRKCDIVFVEFSVNDFHDEPPIRFLAREGLLRQILAPGSTDVVLAHVFCRTMLPDMLKGEQCQSVRDFDELGEYYGLSSVYCADYALRQVRRGLLKMTDWLPDGLHPRARGSFEYAAAIAEFLDHVLSIEKSNAVRAGDLPPPRSADRWEHITWTPIEEWEPTGPWAEHRWTHHTGFDSALETISPSAQIRARVRGHTLAMGWDEGLDAGLFSWKVDGGEWQEYQRQPGLWLPETALYRSVILGSGLDDDWHEVEVRNGLWARDGRVTSRFSVAFLAGITRKV